MRALITNDDGVDSRGIRTLAALAVEAGLETTVAAPGWDSSGAAASLTAVERDGRFLLDRRTFEDLADVEVFAVEAAPAFIVRAAVTGAFGKAPDLVLSGINRGPNTGHAVLHSGTVGAALTASTFGLPAMAVSIDASTDDVEWETGAAVARVALRWLLGTDDRLVLNVNAPNIPLAELRGLRRTGLAAFGAVQTVVTEAGEGYVKLAYEGIDAELEPGTDAAALAGGMASFTALRAVCEECVDGMPDELDLP